MEMLSQIQVRMSEAFSFISFFFFPFSDLWIGGWEENRKKQSGKIGQRANERVRERGSVMGLC